MQCVVSGLPAALEHDAVAGGGVVAVDEAAAEGNVVGLEDVDVVLRVTDRQAAQVKSVV